MRILLPELLVAKEVPLKSLVVKGPEVLEGAMVLQVLVKASRREKEGQC